MSTSRLKQLKQQLHLIPKALYKHYTAPQLPIFYHLRSGFIYFGIGLTLIFLANTELPPSLTQELITLFGLLFVSVGFVITMLAYVRLLIARIIRFFISK